MITEGQPIAERPRKLAGEKLKIAKTEINAMLDMGILRPSRSPWASPLLLKKKKTVD